MRSTELLPFIVYFGAVVLLVLTMLGLSWLLGQRRANKATNMPFESGIVPVGSSQVQLSVEFYLIAIFFVIFDLETVFIFAWAVAFFELGWEGYAAIMVFTLFLGAMVGIYFKTNHMPVRFLIYVAITALTRMLIGSVNLAHEGHETDFHDLDLHLLAITGSILLLAIAALVLRYASYKFPSARATASASDFAQSDDNP